MLLPKIRDIQNSIIKTVSYTLMGLIVFTWVGVSFDMWEKQGTYAEAIVTPYFPQVFPAFILAIALMIAVIITYIEKDNYAYMFAGTGFAVLMADVLTYITYGRFDLILLGFVLWAIIPVVWVYIWKDHVLEETSFKDNIFISLKAALLTYPIYVATAIIAVFGKSGRGIDMGAFGAFNENIVNVIGFFIGVLWLYLLFTVIIVTLMFVAHNFLMHLLSMKRVVTKKGIEYIKVVPKVEAAPVAPKAKLDPYASLLNEMQVFGKYMDQVDRLKAAQTIARFKNEYQTLSAKYNEGSKAESERTIKFIDQEFMKKY
ncbi:MAG TPA: hypothetical protein VGK13_06225 [Methanocellaceae archaeon]